MFFVNLDNPCSHRTILQILPGPELLAIPAFHICLFQSFLTREREYWILYNQNKQNTEERIFIKP